MKNLANAARMTTANEIQNTKWDSIGLLAEEPINKHKSRSSERLASTWQFGISPFWPSFLKPRI